VVAFVSDDARFTTVMYKIAFLIAGSFALFASLILHLRFTRDNARGEKSLTWPTTQGRVVRSHLEVSEHRTQRTDYDDYIEYEYTVAGRTYRSRNVDLQIRNRNDPASIQAFVDSYKVDQQVIVHYDPGQPSEALLIAGPATETSAPRLLWSRILFAVGLILIVAAFLVGRSGGLRY